MQCGASLCLSVSLSLSLVDHRIKQGSPRKLKGCICQAPKGVSSWTMMMVAKKAHTLIIRLVSTPAKVVLACLVCLWNPQSTWIPKLIVLLLDGPHTPERLAGGLGGECNNT